MLIIIFTTIIGLVMLGVKIKEYKEAKKVQVEANIDNKYEKYDFSKGFTVLYIIFALFGIISAGYGIVINHDTTIAMGIIIALLFIGEVLTCQQKYSIYYNDTAFFTKGKLVRYKNIKHFERINNIKFAFVKVVTINGDKIPVSPKSYKILDSKLNEFKIQKLNRKKK